jgi:hypothetical protein
MLTRAADDARIAAHLYPGETVLHFVHGAERPLGALAFVRFLSSKPCLIVATERRLLLIVSKTRFAEASFASVPWGELEHAELVGRDSRTLRISAHAGRWRREFSVRPSYEAHEGIVSLWRKKKARFSEEESAAVGHSESGLMRVGKSPARSRTL